jgi:hypothetical protein
VVRVTETTAHHQFRGRSITRTEVARCDTDYIATVLNTKNRSHSGLPSQVEDVDLLLDQ